MAKFAEDNLRLPQPKEYTNVSQGIDRARPNEAFGSIFKGIGDTISNVVDVVDESQKAEIDKELYTGIDQIRGEQGVDATVLAANTPKIIPDESNTNASGSGSGATKPPPSVDVAMGEISRLRAAYNDGKISDTQYWSKVESLVRQVRTRFPGQRDYIDKRASSITGTTPANALRKSVLDGLEEEKRQRASSVDKQETWIRSGIEHASPASREAFWSGRRDPKFMAEIQSEIANSKANDSYISKKRAALALDDAENKVTAERAEGTLSEDLTQHVNTAMNTGFSAAGGTQLLSKIQTIIASGKAPTPEEINAIKTQFALLESNVNAGLDRILNSPLTPGNPRTYQSIIKDPNKVKQIREMALGPLATLRNAITNNDFGLVAVNANATKAMQDHDTRKVLESNDFWRKMQAAREIVGREGMGVFLNNNMTQLNAATQSLTQLSIAESVAGQGNAKNQFQRLVDNAPKDPTTGKAKVDPKAANATLDTQVGILADTKLDPKLVANVAKSFFDPNETAFIQMFSGPAQQSRVYAKLTSPEVTKNMARVKDTDPKSWENYVNWANRNFHSLNRQAIVDIKENAKSDLGATVAVDEGGKLRVIDMDPQGKRSATPGEAMVRGPRLQALQQRVQNFNLGIDSLSGIYKVEGLKPKEALQALYIDMGVMTKEDKESGNGDSPRSNDQSSLGSPNSLGNQIQLAAYSPEDNAVPGLRDNQIDLDAAPVEAIDLDGPTTQALASGRYAPLLNLIGAAEAPRGYNQLFGRGREAPLTEMTIAEVFDVQRRMKAAGSESTALGRYQFISDTLQAVVKKAGLDPKTTKFTPEVQDKLAVMLAMGRGLGRYLSGSLDKEDFADNLAGEWAGFPLRSGRSKYSGVGSNKATISRQALLNMLDQLQAGQ